MGLQVGVVGHSYPSRTTNEPLRRVHLDRAVEVKHHVYGCFSNVVVSINKGAPRWTSKYYSP